MPTFSKTIPAHHEAVSQLRHDVRDWLHSQVPFSTADDVGLVLTELSANVVDHTSAGRVDVTITLGDRRVTLHVSSPTAAGAIPEVGLWADQPGGDRGYGLRLVRALCSSVEISGDDNSCRVSCVVGFD